MTAQAVTIPMVGESVQEGMIEAWQKQDGEWVERDEVLLNLETDKASVEIAAEKSGTLKILVQAGAVVKIGDKVAELHDTGEKPKPAAKREVKKEAKKENTEKTEKTVPPLEHGPAVRTMLAENKINPEQIGPGQGRDGRLSKEDVLKHLALANKSAPATKTPASTTEPAVSTRRAGSRQERREPMSMLRRRVAERLLTAQQNAAILTTFNEVDMSHVLAVRSKYRDAFEKKYKIKLGFMGFFLKAAVAALENFPKVNAYIDGNDIIYHDYCDIGVAVSTPKGLMVPIIRNAESLTLAGIEQSIADYAIKARESKISIDDLSGGTFTVSNGGVFGSLLSTPILNPPQSAILGMHKTETRAVVLPSGEIAARPMMYLALSYDHRIIDGKEAVGFLVHIKNILEDSSRLVLGV